MQIIQDIINVIEKWAPPQTACKWDNVGLEIGTPSAKANNILLSLDIDTAVLKHIQKHPTDLVITHHPFFFKPIKKIIVPSDTASIIKTCLTTNTSLYTAHTNLDIAQNGVNDTLIEHYNLNPQQGEKLANGIGTYFNNINTTIKKLKQAFPAQHMGNVQKETINTILVCAGSGGSVLKEAFATGLKIDLFITGEINYHDTLFAELNNIAVLASGHKESEVIVLPKIKKTLLKAYPNLSIDILT